ncbi:MAG: flippase activity-associated protein Agl23 [Chthoniobacterales bacterium]
MPSVKNLIAPLGAAILIEGSILLLAALLRLWDLDIKPAHFDEGINGWFVDQMREAGFYRYDPENYHGPLYFYGLFVFLTLFGRNLWALRLPAVLSGIAAVWMTLRFGRFVGARAARFGALALALSPAGVFYGRYAIHEPWFVFALMLTTWGVLGLWSEGRKRDLIATFAGVTLLLLLKETGVIHLVCMALAAGCLMIWQRFVPSSPARPLAGRGWSASDLAWCCALSLLALLFFYSGNFLNWQGLPDFFKAYLKWFQTGTGAGGHEKTDFQFGSLGFLNWYWLSLMGRYEWPALLGLLYAVRLAWPSPALLRYLAIMALGVLAAYSVIPYKTPWCILSILWPFLLLFGCAVDEGLKCQRLRIPSTVACLLLLAVSLIITVRLNFRHFTDPKEPYVYVQTQPGIVVVTDPVLGMAARDPRNHAMGGQIILESYYPLPWIFGEFNRIGYYGKEAVPAVLDGDFIVAQTADQQLIEGRLKKPYLRQRFQLRDSMEECTVWFRESLFASWFSVAGHGKPERVDPETLKKSAPPPMKAAQPSKSPKP